MEQFPQAFGSYKLLDLIGEGGMARVYLATVASVGGPRRLLAIKKMNAKLAGNVNYERLFQREIVVSVQLTHPNIVPIYDFSLEDKHFFLVMEYISGVPLRKLNHKLAEVKKILPLATTCYIVSEICQGLSYAHTFREPITDDAVGIVHRDMSPENVMLAYEGHVKIFDFGVSKVLATDQLSEQGVVRGKPAYMSPEQITNGAVDARADIFSTGVMFWELLTNRRLFAHDDPQTSARMVLEAKIAAPSTINSQVPKELDAIVLKALARNPANRYADARSMNRDLMKLPLLSEGTFGNDALADIVRHFFQAEREEQRQRVRKAAAENGMGLEFMGKESALQEHLGVVLKGTSFKETDVHSIDLDKPKRKAA